MFAGNVEKFQAQTHLPVAKAEVNVFKIEVIERVREESLTPCQLGANREHRAIDEIKLPTGPLNGKTPTVCAHSRGALGDANQSRLACANSIAERREPTLRPAADPTA